MSISLKKGQKISLSKENVGLNRIIVGLGWDEVEKNSGGLFGALFGANKKDIDCDASALALKSGKLTSKDDVVYFGNLRHHTGAIIHQGDNLTGEGEGDDEQIIIDLASLPQEYDKVVIVANIYQAEKRKQHFGMIANAFIRLVDARNNGEICKYNLSDDYSSTTAMVFGEVYRNGGEWKFNAVGQGTTDTSLNALINRFS